MSEENWKELLPEPLREAPYFKNADSVDQVVADIQNAAQWQGNSIRIPGPDASPEDIAMFQSKAVEKMPNLMPKPDVDNPETMAQFYAKLGRPESADGYASPEGYDAAQLKQFALDANITKDQFDKLAERFAAAQAEANEQTLNLLKEQSDGLRAEWGNAYDTRKAEVRQLLEDAPQSVKDAFANETMPADQLKWLHNLAQLGKEAAPVDAQGRQTSTMVTPDEANERLIEIERDLFGMHPGDDGYAALNQKRLKMMAAAAGLSEVPPLMAIDR